MEVWPMGSRPSWKEDADIGLLQRRFPGHCPHHLLHNLLRLHYGRHELCTAAPFSVDMCRHGTHAKPVLTHEQMRTDAPAEGALLLLPFGLSCRACDDDVGLVAGCAECEFLDDGDSCGGCRRTWCDGRPFPATTLLQCGRWVELEDWQRAVGLGYQLPSAGGPLEQWSSEEEEWGEEDWYGEEAWNGEDDWNDSGSWKGVNEHLFSAVMVAAVSRWPRRRVAAQVRPRVPACGRALPQPLRAPSHASVCIPRPFLLLDPTLICANCLHGFPFPPPRPPSGPSSRRTYPPRLLLLLAATGSSASLRPARATALFLLLADSGAPSLSQPLPPACP